MELCFAEDINRYWQIKKKDKEVQASKKLAPDLETIIPEESRYYKIKPSTLRTVRRGIENEPRDGALYLIRSMRAEPLMRIAGGFGLNRHSSVSSAVRRIKIKLQKAEIVILKFTSANQIAAKYLSRGWPILL
jgi:chromosomal replication initiation ATPase DnaA